MLVLQTVLLQVRGGMTVGEQATFIVYVATRSVTNFSRRADIIRNKILR